MKITTARRSGQRFILFYLAFVFFMAAVVVICSLLVRSTVAEFERNQPEYQVEAAMNELVEEAASKDGFWEKYALAEVTVSIYEEGTDVKDEYLKLYRESGLDYAVKNGDYPENERHYVIRKDKLDLAEVVLTAEGEPVTALAVFTSRVWKIKEIKPIFKTYEYSLEVPENFTVTVNGIELTNGEADENGFVKLTVSGVYREPDFNISDGRGNKLSYVVNGSTVIPEYYDYTLVLPHTLTVTVNGEKNEGTPRDDGFVLYEIYLIQKPEIKITDLYGNEISYSGKSFDLTHTVILAPDTFKVTVDGNTVPLKAVNITDNAEYSLIADIVKNAPKQAEYSIAVLKKDVDIAVTDFNGNGIEINAEEKLHDLMDTEIFDAVPEKVSAEIDVLEVAQSWSLFMSNDLKFAEMKKLMLEDTNQYKAAKDYATGIDKTYFSEHTLLDPTFTENEVKNFRWITEDCFSVEVSFVKHMKLTKTGKQKDDPMNDRFYFVKQDGKWLFAAMKEVVTDGE